MKLAEVEKEAKKAVDYMRDISDYVRDVVSIGKNFSVNDLGESPEPIGRCSECPDGSLFEGFSTYDCMKKGEKFLVNGCGMKIYKNLYGRYLDRSTLAALLNDRHLKEVEGFVGQAGKPVLAELFLEKGSIRLASASAVVDVTAAESGSTKTYGSANSADAPEVIGVCPMHEPGPCNILALRNSFLCEERLKQLKDKKDDITGFWLARSLCGKEIGPEVVQQLLASGKSEVIKGFVSKAGNKFNASLELMPDGKVNFAFEKSDRQGASYGKQPFKKGGESARSSTWQKKKKSPPERGNI
jgi:DNA topoisomerase-3